MLPVRKGRPGRGLGARAEGPGLLASHRQGCLFLGPGGRAVDQAWAGRQSGPQRPRPPGRLSHQLCSDGGDRQPLLRGLDLLNFIQCCLLMLLSLPWGATHDPLNEGTAAFRDVLITILSISKCTNLRH